MTLDKKFQFVCLMFEDMKENLEKYVSNEMEYQKVKELYDKSENKSWRNYPIDKNFQNKNHGKTVLKQKITFLRQELLNLERMLDK